jgi:hypothetical protein
MLDQKATAALADIYPELFFRATSTGNNIYVQF